VIKRKIKDFLSLLVKHVGYSIIISIAIIGVLLLIINLYTYHKRAFPVPDFYGMTKKEVIKTAKEKHLRYEITDSIYQQDAKKGAVIDQHPSPGFKVKKNRRIFLILNAHKPDKVEMPDLNQQTLRQAKSILENKGLYIGDIIYKPDMAINRVLKQKHKGKEIKPGREIEKGSSIDLVLGNGYSNKKTVPPNLIGLSLREARNRLTNEYLNIGAIIYDTSVSNFKDTLKAKIWKQKPSHSSKRLIRLGTEVDIWLTNDSLKIN